MLLLGHVRQTTLDRLRYVDGGGISIGWVFRERPQANHLQLWGALSDRSGSEAQAVRPELSEAIPLARACLKNGFAP